ncbi:MAG: hypothetical protein IJ986_09075 [Bacteroidales bacterium]|nr:hypothetical protein [Bacteroidales bacterium]
MKGKDRQTVADVALVVSGSEEAIFDLARLNGVSLDTEVSGLEILEVSVLDRQVTNYYRLNGIVPASVLEEAISAEHDNQE